MDVNTFADIVVRTANPPRAKAWANFTETVVIGGQPIVVGIKAHGRWVQRIECCGLKDSAPEYRTQSAMRAGIVAMVISMAARLGVKTEVQA